jgi:hypothetical protein
MFSLLLLLLPSPCCRLVWVAALAVVQHQWWLPLLASWAS